MVAALYALPKVLRSKETGTGKALSEAPGAWGTATASQFGASPFGMILHLELIKAGNGVVPG